ncbi:zinc-binding dehydrogenase [Streptomyces sp. NPDC048419]|uniref:zinc-binding dehydrogenase n=1 Tax=Streptomyces sp. NPDC048419 TaxID=3365547 RepID=UPI003724828D
MRALGADQVIDYQVDRFEEFVSNVDAVLDTVGEHTQERSYRVHNQGGSLISIVPVADADADADAAWPNGRRSFFMHPDGVQLTRLTDFVRDGWLRPRLATCFLVQRHCSGAEHTRGGRRPRQDCELRVCLTATMELVYRAW